MQIKSPSAGYKNILKTLVNICFDMLYHKCYDANTTNKYLTVLFEKYYTFYIVEYILSYVSLRR